jgi:alanine dehydrogenase
MDTLLLSRKDVAELITLDECIAAVESAFRLYGEGKADTPKVLGLHTLKGGLHIKAGILNLNRTYLVAKLNSNFQHNMSKYHLPLIQGVAVVYDGETGEVLAVMDSIELTIKRTGAATAVAAKYLSRTDAKTAMICGCGNQGEISLKALMKVRSLEKVYAYDVDVAKAEKFARTLSGTLNIAIEAVNDLNAGLTQSAICITCTPSTQAFLQRQWVLPGTFIAAVGADSEDKQELAPELLSENKVITDITDQCKSIGELHHAIAKGLMAETDVYAELSEIIAGKKRGRINDDEIIIFDSTGTALQDVATAAIIYERALRSKAGLTIDFAH